METGPFDKIKIRINGQGDIKIDKTKNNYNDSLSM